MRESDQTAGAPAAATTLPATTLSAAIDRRAPGAMQLAIVIGVFVLSMIDGVDFQLLSLVAPVVLKEWGVTRAVFGPALAASLVGMAVGAVAGGWLADRIGRRVTILGSTLLFAAATLACAFARDVPQLAAMRFVAGTGFGAAGPVALALAIEWLAPRHRPWVMGPLAVSVPIGGVAGSALVLGLLPALGWRGMFVACGLASLAYCGLMALVLRESPAWLLARGRTAEAGRVLAPLLRGEALDPHLPEAERAGGGIADLFRGRLGRFTLGCCLAQFFVCVIAYAVLSWTPVLLTDAGAPFAFGARAILAFNLSSTCCSLVTGMLVPRLGGAAVPTLAGVAIALVMLLLWRTFALGDIGGNVVVLTGLAGATMGVLITSIFAITAIGYPAAVRGAGIGFTQMVGRAGGIVMVVGGGPLLDRAGHAPAPFFALLAACALPMIAGTLVMRALALGERRDAGGVLVAGH